MKIETIDIEAAIENTRKLLKNEPSVSPALKGAIELLVALVILMMNQLGLNSQNSSKPPSSDPNRKKKKKTSGDRKAGGQKGHTGTTLQKFDEPDHIENIPVDRQSIPQGKYKDVGMNPGRSLILKFHGLSPNTGLKLLKMPMGNGMPQHFLKESTALYSMVSM